MSLLNVVILLSLGLAAVALLGGVGTIISHPLRKRFERKHNLRRDSILRRIVVSFDTPGWDFELIEAIGRDPRLSIDLLSEMSELIRGENRERVVLLYKKAGIERWLFRKLRSGRAAQRRLAADTLGLFPSEITLAALTASLDDRDEAVRLTAALSLAQLGALPSVSTLVTKLLESTRQQSLLLHQLIESVAVSRPYEVMELARGKFSETFLRPIAISALAKAGHLELSKDLGDFILDSDPEVRAAALAAVARLGDLSAKDHIKAALADPVQFVRVRAIDAVRRLELNEFVPELVCLLRDDNWWVQFRASEALTELGHGKRVVEVDRVTERRMSNQRGAA